MHSWRNSLEPPARRQFVLACGWESHAEHSRASRWLSGTPSFATCPLYPDGILRISLSPAFAASFQDAIAAVIAIVEMRTHKFLLDATDARFLPQVNTSKDVTDAQLIILARR